MTTSNAGSGHQYRPFQKVATILSFLMFGSWGWSQAGVTIFPGDVLDFADAQGGNAGTTDIFLIDEESSYQLAPPLLKAEVSKIIPPTFGEARAWAYVYNDFHLQASPGTEENPVVAFVTYDVQWAGFILKLINLFSDPTVDVFLTVKDLTASQVVAKELVHSTDFQTVSLKYKIKIGDIGGSFDEGRKKDIFPVLLRRGHSYRLQLDLRAKLFAFPNDGLLTSDYMDFPNDGGVWWNQMTVKVGVDDVELAQSLAQLPALQVLVGQLQEAVDGLRTEVDLLREQLMVHTHSYLTGEGAGHNNVEVKTSVADLPEEVPRATAWRSRR